MLLSPSAMPDSSISDRKADHIELCAEDDVGFKRTSTLLECVRLVHDALPDMKLSEVDTSVTMLGKKLRAPIVIAAMTGGTDQAARINRDLAGIAEERGYGFGLGSQRAMHLRPAASATYRVREIAPTALVLGNVGVVQARAMTTSEVRLLLDEVGADALCVHLNPAMELVQPGGDRDFSQGLATIERLVGERRRCRWSSRRPAAASRRRSASASATSGSSTSTCRARGARRGSAWRRCGPARRATQRSHALGAALWDWGIPTAASVALLAPLGFETIVATGGVGDGPRRRPGHRARRATPGVWHVRSSRRSWAAGAATPRRRPSRPSRQSSAP